MPSSIYKVPNGKLIKLFFEIKENKITEFRLTGDFFIYPEEAIYDIENFLIGKSIEDRKNLETELGDFINIKKIELFGVNCESIVETVFLASPPVIPAEAGIQAS